MPNKPVPAPSKGALRLLRDIVFYSSAGTAAGTAVVLAEERRRRICTASKIAENAKRIKSSDRYVHTVAIAEQGDVAYIGQHPELATNWLQHVPIKDVKSPFSASEIDKAYERTEKRPRKRRLVNQNGEKAEPGVIVRKDEGHVAPQPGSKAPPVRSKININKLVLGKVKEAKKTCSERIIEAIHGDLPGRALSYFYDYYKTADALPSTMVARMQLRESSVAFGNASLTRPVLPVSTAIDDARTHESVVQELRKEELGSIVDVFLDLFPKGNRGKNVMDVPPRTIAAVLLNLAAQSGVLEIVQRLLLWLKAHRCLCAEDIQEACERLLQNSQDPETLKRILYLSRRVLPSSDQRYDDRFVRKILDTALMNSMVDEAYDWLKFSRPSDARFDVWSAAVVSNTERLLGQSGFQKAWELFTSTLHIERMRHITTHCVKLAEKLSNDASRAGALEQCEQILSWTLSHGHVSRVCLENLVRVCELRGSYSTVISLLNRYQEIIMTSPDVYATTCKAFALGAPLDSAVEFIQAISTKDLDLDTFRKCQDSYSILLHRCWEDTKSLEKVQSLFHKFESWSGQRALPSSVQNAMIWMCAEADKVNEVQKHLRDVEHERSTESNSITLDHVMLANAMDGDWSTVYTLLQDARTTSSSEVTSSISSVSFNPILKMFCRSHNASQIHAFVIKAIDECGVVPDQGTLDLVLEALIREGRVRKIAPWVRFFRLRGYDLKIDARSVAVMFKRYFLEYRPSHMTLMKIFGKLRHMDRLIVSKELYAVIRDGVAFDLRKARPQNRNRNAFKEWVDRRLKIIERLHRAAPPLSALVQPLKQPSGSDSRSSAGSLGDTKTTHSDMVLALSLNRPTEAVEIYKQSLATGYPQSSLALEIAVEASIRTNHGDAAESIDLVRQSSSTGLNVNRALGPLLLHRMYKEQQDPDRLRDTVLEFYRTMEANKIPVKHFIAVAAANHLVNRGRADAAISLLIEIHKSTWAKQKALDIAAMTVFLRAYAAAKNLRGVKWVVSYVLTTDMRLDAMFAYVLRDARRPFLDILGRRPGSLGKRLSKEDVVAVFDRWRTLCHQRGREQRTRARKLGLELVKLLRNIRVNTAKVRDCRLKAGRASGWRPVRVRVVWRHGESFVLPRSKRKSGMSRHGSSI